MNLENDGAEGLILDLREGWGGASPDYLHMFRCDLPETRSIDRAGESHRWFRCTAGAVTAGKLFVLSDGSLLYLAVGDVLVDGERLEGVGVAPDIEVPFDIRYAAGKDPQLDRAIEVRLERLPPVMGGKAPG